MDKFKKWLKENQKTIGAVGTIVVVGTMAYFLGKEVTHKEIQPYIDEMERFCADLRFTTKNATVFVDKEKNIIDFDQIVGILGKETEKKVNEALGADLYDSNMSIVFAI